MLPIPTLNDKGYITLGRVAFMEAMLLKLGPWQRRDLEGAYAFSKFAHAKIEREDGTRYFDHPKTVAWLLVCHFDFHYSELAVAALLHDMMEDSFIMDYERLTLNFGSSIAVMVRELSKNGFADQAKLEYARTHNRTFMNELGAMGFGVTHEIRPEFFEKETRNRIYFLYVTHVADWMVKAIKVADRLHNILTSEGLTPEKRLRKLAETQEFFPAIMRSLAATCPQSELVRVKLLCRALELAMDDEARAIEQLGATV